ncbi:DUF5606 family protein [Moheibacter sediminis]|uniref:Uncharacterized protein n=1 Tax=Moheibacter sediminis TaxID=1434700 RepID=A0A1W1ZS91_9FLAO|nr:DUF5606 domain-containing protein [Moheibacter sediminis]SMC51267.1 hypothetical protein SAMN06296427_103197 [Moheibacter sediminis]
MDLTKIISISGKPGLFKLVSQAKGSFIVEDLDKGKKTSISAHNNVSLLENVAIYGVSDEFPLKEVFTRIFNKENGGTAISHKESGANLRKYIEEVLPEYDESRVYDSDLKKLFQWYNILQAKGLVTPAPETEEAPAEAKTEEKPKKTKKAAAPKADKEEAAEKKAPKKAAAKKKED